MAATRHIALGVEPAWAAAFTGACVGIMTMTDVLNPERDERLDALLDGTAADLRTRFAGAQRTDLIVLPDLAAYIGYYRRFDKTYHVLLQLESVALRGKPLRARGTLVGAMFRAELTTHLLTAGHDSDRLDGPLTLDVAGAGERYVGMGGREIEAAAGDMCIRDATGIVSSVIYGPDDRTRLNEETRNCAFTTYAPAGIEPAAVRRHLEGIAADVRVVAPAASIATLEVVTAPRAGQSRGVDRSPHRG